MNTELSPREVEALTLYTRGYTRPQVARRMGLTENTVRGMLKTVKAKYAAAGRPAYTKLELRNRAIEDHHIDARADVATSGGSWLLDDGAWSPATSPTARKLGILYRPTGRLAA